LFRVSILNKINEMNGLEFVDRSSVSKYFIKDKETFASVVDNAVIELDFHTSLDKTQAIVNGLKYS